LKQSSMSVLACTIRYWSGGYESLAGFAPEWVAGFGSESWQGLRRNTHLTARNLKICEFLFKNTRDQAFHTA
jgi:hypothetical protein